MENKDPKSYAEWAATLTLGKQVAVAFGRSIDLAVVFAMQPGELRLRMVCGVGELRAALVDGVWRVERLHKCPRGILLPMTRVMVLRARRTVLARAVRRAHAWSALSSDALVEVLKLLDTRVPVLLENAPDALDAVVSPLVLAEAALCTTVEEELP